VIDVGCATGWKVKLSDAVRREGWQSEIEIRVSGPICVHKLEDYGNYPDTLFSARRQSSMTTTAQNEKKEKKGWGGFEKQ
jgi:hypothetical protein